LLRHGEVPVTYCRERRGRDIRSPRHIETHPLPESYRTGYQPGSNRRSITRTLRKLCRSDGVEAAQVHRNRRTVAVPWSGLPDVLDAAPLPSRPVKVVTGELKNVRPSRPARRRLDRHHRCRSRASGDAARKGPKGPPATAKRRAWCSLRETAT